MAVTIELLKGIGVMPADSWPFDQPRNCATLTLRTIVFGGEPILRVSHDEDDHSWQFLDGRAPKTANAAVVTLSEIVDLDPSVIEVADLPPGWIAVRATKTSAWKRV